MDKDYIDDIPTEEFNELPSELINNDIDDVEIVDNSSDNTPETDIIFE